MNARLSSLLAEAASLPEAEQEALADLLEDFLVTDEADALLTPEELAHLDRLLAEPFVEADPARIAALFARIG